MKVQFRSTRMDGSQGEWHDVLTPDGYGRRWLAPDQGWSGIEFREVPDDEGVLPEVIRSSAPSLDSLIDRAASGEAHPGPVPACTCGGGSFHVSDCPT